MKRQNGAKHVPVVWKILISLVLIVLNFLIQMNAENLILLSAGLSDLFCAQAGSDVLTALKISDMTNMQRKCRQKKLILSSVIQLIQKINNRSSCNSGLNCIKKQLQNYTAYEIFLQRRKHEAYACILFFGYR